MSTVRLIFASTSPDSSYYNADLLWKIGMHLHDPHFFIEFPDNPGRGILIAGSLEINRAKKEAKNTDVVSADEFRNAAEAGEAFGVLGAFLRSRNTAEIELHPDTPAEVMEKLRDRFAVSVGTRPWYPERIAKTPEEIVYIKESIRAAQTALGYIRERIASAAVKDGVLTDGTRALTSGTLRDDIENEFYRCGFVASGSIISCGAASADPHAAGDGPLRGKESIVCDIFPRSRSTGYYADITRTFFKGAPDGSVENAYEAVFDAQAKGIGMVRVGVDGKDIHNAVTRVFESRGYKTDFAAGEGFIHSTGHGVGLECHEILSIGERSCMLSEFSVITIEPGLYYPSEEFGIRIEDMVLIGEYGSDVLTSYPKDFASAVFE